MSKFKTAFKIYLEVHNSTDLVKSVKHFTKEYISKEDLYKAFSEVNNKWEDFGFIKKLIEELERD